MKKIDSYRSGLDPVIKSRRNMNRDRILQLLGADLSDWEDHRWQQRNVFRDAHSIAEVVNLSNEEGAAIELANMHGLPFGITPYDLSLFDHDASRTYDHTLRAQVIPPLSYISGILESKSLNATHLDFMKEGQTSPVDLVTRRYPMIAILKPFNACAQSASIARGTGDRDTCPTPRPWPPRRASPGPWTGSGRIPWSRRSW